MIVSAFFVIGTLFLIKGSVSNSYLQTSPSLSKTSTVCRFAAFYFQFVIFRSHHTFFERSQYTSIFLNCFEQISTAVQNTGSKVFLSGYFKGRLPMYSALIPVSYTHLTLPTILLVQISVVAVSLKKKKQYYYANKKILKTKISGNRRDK
eukprot:TRINITY_DN8202_c0_g1_i2.p1 TRINITY_DN8202_c0_g1~~TRINITY_DN8202_c0_g1_i2.p1  ORF type:complete len:150 (-),score=9.75 TRINITY_DN8202_c0_g1_i2:49-498(-)